MKIFCQMVVVLSLLVTAVPAAMALEEGSLVLTSSILRQVNVENEKGEKEINLVPVQKAIPGEELIIQVSFVNHGSDPADNIVIVNPVPDQMLYVSGSATGDFTLVTFSIDGGVTFDLPEKLVVKDETGEERPASPKQYTHVRFTRTKTLAPGQTDKVSFRAVLE